MPVTTIQFVLHLVGACALGALVGLELLWTTSSLSEEDRQRIS